MQTTNFAQMSQGIFDWSFIAQLQALWNGAEPSYWKVSMLGKHPNTIANNTMGTSQSIFTLLCVIGISVGQLLFKKAAAALPTTPSLTALIQNYWLIAALALYALTTLGWVWVLRNAPLHLAYPFMGLAFLIVPTLAWLFLGEPLHWRTLVGGAFILVGVALASTS